MKGYERRKGEERRGMERRGKWDGDGKVIRWWLEKRKGKN
jgi:hypothetical protein